jgi:putative transposase
MKTMRVYHLNSLSPMHFRRLKEAQREAARVWNLCMETHKEARMTHSMDLHHRTRGQFALNAQVVQQIVRPSSALLKPRANSARSILRCT